MNTNVLLSLGAAAMFVAAAAGCDKKAATDTEPRETQTTSAEKPSVDDVKDEPSRFYGKKVTLTGGVDDVGNDGRSFKLEGSGWLFDDEIRVLARSPVKLAGSPLGDDHDVVVTGTVRRFVRAELDRELGWNLAPELEVELKEKPVLIADEVRGVESSATWTAQKPEGEIVSVVTIISAVSPDALAGQKISLDNTIVQTVTGKGLWVGPTHANQTFVLPPEGTDLSNVKPGDSVSVRGTVKKTPPAAEAVKTWGLPQTLRATVEREPLYVEASRVEPVGGSTAQNKAGAGPKEKGMGEAANEGATGTTKAKTGDEQKPKMNESE